jgi:hypothetical protein
MWYGDKRESVVNIAHRLIERGWKIYGYHEDQSDSMTDYYHPASWDGIAEKDGFVLLVDVYGTSASGKQVTKQTVNVDWERIRKLEALRDDAASPEGEKQACQYQINKMLEKAEASKQVVKVYPTFKYGNPGKCNWHLEKDGEILDKGIGAYQIQTDYNKYREEGQKDLDEKFNNWYARIKKAITSDEQLEKQIKKVVNKVTKPVEVAAVKPSDFVKHVTCIKMEVDYTGGLYKGKILTYTRTYEGAKNSYIFVKLGKKLKPLTEKAENMMWLSDEKLNKMLEKGHISFVELQEVEEVAEKVVYKKTARKAEQTADNMEEVITITGEVAEVEEQHTEQPEAQQQTTFEAATPKQLFALHMASKRTIDTRGMNISKGKASELIGRSKNGEDITEELKAIKEGKTVVSEEPKQEEKKSNVVDFMKAKEQKQAEQPKNEEQEVKEEETQNNNDQTGGYEDMNNSDTFVMDDILGAFDSVEIENNTRIDSEDLEICETLQTAYDEFLKFHDNYLEFMKNNQVKNELYNNHGLSTKMIEEATEKTTQFIYKIVRHFEKKYNITINEDKFNKIYTAGSVSYEDIIDQIFIQLDGHSLTEKAEKEIKDTLKDKVRYEKFTIKNNKITITDYVRWDSWAWDGETKISYSDEKLKALFVALSHFESNNSDMNDTFKKTYNEFYEGSKKHAILDKYNFYEFKKVKAFRAFKNKKVEIEFSSNQTASLFAREYCGVNQTTAAV